MSRELAVVYDLGSASPREIAQAAQGLAEPMFVADTRNAHAHTMLPVLAEYGQVLDLARLSLDEAAGRLRGAAGIVTFCESRIPLAAELATRSGLTFHSPSVAAALTDKARQRELLNAAGIAPTRQAAARTAADFAAARRHVGLPAVIKPRNGTGSADTVACWDEADYDRTTARILSEHDGVGWVVEELIPAGAHPAGDWLADFCSVESAVAGDDIWHFAVTDRLRLAAPFRETGSVLPSCLPPDLYRTVCDLAAGAIRALGVSCGVVHTEVKLSVGGARVIEVNGRLGGNIGRLMRRAAGLDPVRLAVELALGEAPTPRSVGFDRVAFLHGLVPPAEPVRVVAAGSAARFRAIDGVWAVERSARAGQVLDWRRGNLERVLTLWGEAADTSGVRRALAEIQHTAAETVTFEPVA